MLDLVVEFNIYQRDLLLRDFLAKILLCHYVSQQNLLIFHYRHHHSMRSHTTTSTKFANSSVEMKFESSKRHQLVSERSVKI